MKMEGTMPKLGCFKYWNGTANFIIVISFLNIYIRQLDPTWDASKPHISLRGSCLSIYKVHFLNHLRIMLVASASLQVSAFSVSPFAKELGQSWYKFV
jgi:hypothetical protein